MDANTQERGSQPRGDFVPANTPNPVDSARKQVISKFTERMREAHDRGVSYNSRDPRPDNSEQTDGTTADAAPEGDTPNPDQEVERREPSPLDDLLGGPESADADRSETRTTDDGGDFPTTYHDLADALGLESDGLDNLTITYKVDGEERETTIAELRNGYMRREDYDRKRQQEAQRLKEHAAELRTQTDKQVDELATSIAAVERLVAATEPDPSLAYEDPQAFIQQKAMHEKQKADLQAAKEAVKKDVQEQTAERKRQYDRYIADQRDLLSRKLPGFDDPAKRDALMNKMADYLRGYGMPDETMNSIDNGPLLLAIHDGMRFQELSKLSPEKAKALKAKPAPVRPKSTQNLSPQERMGQLRKVARERGQSLTRAQKEALRSEVTKGAKDMVKRRIVQR